MKYISEMIITYGIQIFINQGDVFHHLLFMLIPKVTAGIELNHRSMTQPLTPKKLKNLLLLTGSSLEEAELQEAKAILDSTRPSGTRLDT